MSEETGKNEEVVDPVTGEQIVPQASQEEMEERMDSGPSLRQVLREKADRLGISYSPNIGDDKLKERIDAHMAELEGDEAKDSKTPQESVMEEQTSPEEPKAPKAVAMPSKAERETEIEPKENRLVQTSQSDMDAPVEGAKPAVTLAQAGVSITPPGRQPVDQSLNKKGVSAQTHRSRSPGMPDRAKIPFMTQDEIAALPKNIRTRVIRERLKREALALVRIQIFCNNPAKNDLKGEIFSVGNKYVGTIRKMIPYGGEANEVGYHVPRMLVDMLKDKKYQRVRSVKNPDGTERVETVLAPEFTINELPPLTPEELARLAQMQQARNASVGFVGA